MLITFVTGFKIEIKSQANFQLRFWLTRNYSGEDDLIKYMGLEQGSVCDKIDDNIKVNQNHQTRFGC